MTAFGNYLRAARLGFHWSPRLEAFLRLTDLPGGRWLAELAPRGCLPSAPARAHRVWWEGEQDPDAVVALSPGLLAHARPAGPVSIVLDDTGAEVR